MVADWLKSMYKYLKRHLGVNSVWHDADDVPKFNVNGISDFIVNSCYGRITGSAHTYSAEQWSAHVGFKKNRQLKWAYESDLIDL